MSKVHLLPCPWNCGADNEEYMPYLIEDGCYEVRCGWCEMPGPSEETKEEAISRWNNRKELNETEEYKRGYYDCKKQFLKLIEDGLNSEEIKEEQE